MDLSIHKLVEGCTPSELREQLSLIKEKLGSEEFHRYIHLKKELINKKNSKLKILIEPVIFYSYCTIEKTNILLEFNFDINIKSLKNDKNALFFTDTEKTKYLLEKGIEKQNLSVNTRNIKPNALFGANIEKLKLLLNHGYDVFSKDYMKRTLMFSANDIETVDFLIQKGLSVNDADDAGNNMIMNNSKECSILEKLIEKGLDINHKNDSGFTAIFGGSFENLKMLLEYGADVSQVSNIQTTCAFNHVEGLNVEEIKAKIKLLKSYGLDLNHENHYGLNVLFSAQSEEVIEFLISEGVKAPAHSPRENIARINNQFEKIQNVLIKMAAEKEKEDLLKILNSGHVKETVQKRRI